MVDFKPTYLYIKTHQITGLKYFGKTINNPYRYYGSGIYWLRHLKEHGYKIDTEVLGLFYEQQENFIHYIREAFVASIIKPKNGGTKETDPVI